VTSPETGNSFVVSETINIHWIASGVKGNVKITLRKADGSGGTVIEESFEVGRLAYRYNLKNVKPGTYFIKIKQGKIFGKSTVFKVIEKPKITVLKPKSGNYKKSESLKIEWKTSGVSGNIKIVLRKADGSGGIVIKENYPTNKLLYSYPLSKVPSGKYFIKIKQGVVFGVSSIFDVLEKSKPVLPSYIRILAPSGNEDLFTGQKVFIKWAYGGSDIDSKIIIDLYQGATKIINIIPFVTISDKMFDWSIPTSLKSGKYQIKITTIDGKVTDDSAVITINKLSVVKPQPLQGQIVVTAKPVQRLPYTNINNSKTDFYDKRKPVKFYSPRLGFVWKPLKDYRIEFEVFKKKWGYGDFFVDVMLVSAETNNQFSPIVIKENLHIYSKNLKDSYIYNLKWKFRGDYNIPSGKYKIYLKQRRRIFNYKIESDAFSIENQNSSDTAFIGGDESDLILEDVYYDYASRWILITVKNQGYSQFKGDIKVSYSFEFGKWSKFSNKKCINKEIISDSKKFNSFELKRFETKILKIYNYDCFIMSPGLNKPLTGPAQYNISLESNGNKNTDKKGMLCNTKKSDIMIFNSYFNLYMDGMRSKKLYIYGAYRKTTVSPDYFAWSGKSFKSPVMAEIWNWGCKTRTFKIELHMDGPYLNGKNSITLGTMTLKPGEEKVFMSQPVRFTIPRDAKFRRILLVADQDEKNSQGYPSSYRNNFILSYLRIYKEDNVIRGR
jgi:hypothetical protein